ncbi:MULTISPECIES: hypothetical protein [Acidobacteriaceae]|uniref:hypothetical protein n=1 Tax=Acidobacteriaceae TaxID=204434 RepID=UPI00131B4602|nr:MULTISPECIES: hypothetical protein [Acidobacteriaceae]
MEAARQFTHGNLHPHWAFSPAYNAGEPRFVFYPPLSWTLGAILGFLMPWSWTPIVYTWLALTAAGLALYRLAREFSTANAALIAAAFYLVNPYTLFTAYERTAYAELLAAAWIPLLLLGILRKRVTIPGIAIPVALLWLTNDPVAVMGCYTLALLTFIRIFTTNSIPNTQSDQHQPTSRLQLAATSVVGAILGLGLASFYLVPAVYERRYVQIAAIFAAGTHIENHFLFHHTANPAHNAIINTASFIAIALLLLTAAAIATAAHHSSPPKEREARPPTNLLILLATLTIVIAFLLASISNPIWQHLPELRFLQFPWRLLTILAAVLSLALALALASLKIRTIPAVALSLALAALLAFPGFHLFRQQCSPERSVVGTIARFRANTGTAANNEYTPIAASNQSLSHTNPPFWLLPNQPADANTSAPANSTPGSAPTSLTLNSPQPQILVLNLRDYPAWRLTLNQTILTIHLQRSDGLIAIPIPAGFNHIAITYSRNLDQTLGDILTLLSLALLLLILRPKPYPAA